MNIQARPSQHTWYPCSQMKDHEKHPPLPIISAEGCYLMLAENRPIIDAISSWWCKSLGHSHPALKKALIEQMERYEHVLMVDIHQPTLEQLSARLAQLLPGLNKVFYASDGSSAVEIALKMSLQAQRLRGEPHRTGIMALENDYHGETCLALAASDVGSFREHFEAVLPRVNFLRGLPYVNSCSDPLFENCEAQWPVLQKQLDEHAETLAVIIIEPIIQGSCGMKLYSADFLRRLSAWCKAHGVYLIADEIMTGLGRTGTPLAVNHAGITPDFVCLSKGLTAGWLPMSAVLCHEEVYQLFYDDYDTGKMFIHSHTYGGNALAASVALANLQIMETDRIYEHINNLSHYLFDQMKLVAEKTQRLTNLRHIGFVVAADLVTTKPRAGYDVYQHALSLGALLRPLGNTLYWLPPFVITKDIIDELRDITCAAILQTPL